MIGLGSDKYLTGTVSVFRYRFHGLQHMSSSNCEMFMRLVRSAATMIFFLSLSSKSEIVASIPMQCVFVIEICVNHCHGFEATVSLAAHLACFILGVLVVQSSPYYTKSTKH